VDWAPDLVDYTGLCEPYEGKITIGLGMDNHQERDTLLHEVMHATLRMQGRPYTEEEEVYVTALATGLISVLDANPKLRKHLLAPKDSEC
jgi:hypothetical protein